MDLTSVEIKHWVDENKGLLVNSRIDKIWQLDDVIIIRFYVYGKGTHEMIIGKGAIFLTTYRIEKPQTPTNFAMLLRKHLSGKKIVDVYQHNLDRIIVLEFEDKKLVVEFLKPQNVILVDEKNKILGLLKPVKSKTRILEQGKEYLFPLSKENIFSISFERFKEIAQQNQLSSILGIPPKYVSYVQNKTKSLEEQYTLFKEIYVSSSPCVCDKKVYAYCIDPSCRFFENLNTAIESVAIEEIREVSFEKKEEKNKKIEYMTKGLDKLQRDKDLLEKKVHWLSENISLLEEILRSPQQHEKYVEKIDYKERKIYVSTPYGVVSVWENLSPYQNLSKLFDEIKRLKLKIKSLEERIEHAKKEETKKEETKKIVVEKKQKKKWYEKFKWFVTSQNKLFVLGKDASTNEVLIKKYMEPNDLVFHMLLPGSGFGLLKEGRESATSQEIMECAQFTASHSSLWKQKVFSGEVFWVYPEQVSKKPPSGEYMGKGSFMIYGKKNILTVPLELSFGYDEENKEVIYGPLIKILSLTKHYAIIIPGDKKAKDLVDKIKRKLCRNLSKEHCSIVMAYDEEYFREKIPFGIGDIRGKV